MKRVFQVVGVGLLALSLGLHWALLQTVAWAGMLANYSSEGPLSEAVAKTFSGRHPCSLCLFVREGRAAEKRADSQPAGPRVKFEPGLQWEGLRLFFLKCGDQIVPQDLEALVRSEEPPKPRPRPTDPRSIGLA